MLIFLLFSHEIFSQTFQIMPKGILPETVPLYGKVSAYYTVSNITGLQLNENFVKNLPADVTQVTCDPKYCGATFNLGPKGSGADSCVLKLTIKGPVKATSTDLLVCTEGGINCDTTSDLLNVGLAPKIPFVGIAAGSYSNNFSGIFPLLATTNDSGNDWLYPPAIFKNLQNAIDPAFTNGVLSNAACTASQASNVCIAPGQWCSGSFCEHSLPLIAVGTQNTASWIYPKSVCQDLKTNIEPNFISGELRAASCFGSGGNAVCIASGMYFTDTEFFPLLALSSDGGKQWTYPDSIFKNLTTAIEPEFKKGYLASASCTDTTCNTVCVASGNFCTTEGCDFQKPLLALSTDKGKHWTYPSAVFKDLKIQLDPAFQSGFFISSSCTGKGNQARCVAAGSYSNGASTMPLLTLSKDGGASWTYPKSILTDLAARIGHGFIGGLFNAASCSGEGDKAVCIASGSYFRKSGAGIPFLALSRDGGDTWTYPPFIYTKLKTIVDPDFVGGTFDGASCIGSGKKTICTAAGNYCNKQQSCFPLLVLSTNGGKNWSYPPSVYSILTSVIDPNFKLGLFSSVSCSGIPENNFCTAAGQYSNNTSETFPLLAFSKDSGQTWSYPPYIFKNLTTTIEPGFAIGQFNKAATSGLTP
jgi:hypothetical protein